MVANDGKESNEALARWYEQRKIRTSHPNLKVNYFEEIDAKDKAYWLGFLYADGTLTRKMTKTGKPHGVRIQLELSIYDENIIDRFCESLGLNKDKKRYRRHERTNSVEIKFGCKKMADDLLKHGVIFEKSRSIEFPRLPNRESELAFLLGYYDGDGKENAPEISSSSTRFLEQIQERFHLPYRIQVYSREKEIYGRRIKGMECRLRLDKELFNEMLRNYANSMFRKRVSPKK
jgi:hypothetical protein